MKAFKVYRKTSGHIFGVYPGDDAEGAIAAAVADGAAEAADSDDEICATECALYTVSGGEDMHPGVWVRVPEVNRLQWWNGFRGNAYLARWDGKTPIPRWDGKSEPAAELRVDLSIGFWRLVHWEPSPVTREPSAVDESGEKYTDEQDPAGGP